MLYTSSPFSPKFSSNTLKAANMGKPDDSHIKAVSAHSPSSSDTTAQKSAIARTTGFQRPYNLVLCRSRTCLPEPFAPVNIYYTGFVFGGILFAFCLARLPMLDVDGFYKKNGGIGEYYFFTKSLYKGAKHQLHYKSNFMSDISSNSWTHSPPGRHTMYVQPTSIFSCPSLTVHSL